MFNPDEFDEGANKPKDAKKPTIDKEQLARKRKRLLTRCYIALEEIGDVINARNLAPGIIQILTEAGPTNNLPTITR